MYKWIVLFFFAFLTACGGGGGSGSGDSRSTTTEANAKVGLVITDATADEYKSALVTFTKAELVGDDERVVLFSGEQTLDLLKLPDFYEFVDTAEVPPGEYHSVWITATKVELVSEDGSGNDVVKEAKLPSGVIKVLSKSGFSIASGDVLFLEIDFDMNKALKLTHTGSGKIILRPVVFANIYSEPPHNKFVRIHGIIDSVSGESFELCQTQLITDSDNSLPESDDQCFTIVTDIDTGVFNSNGLPSAEDLQENTSVTVIGRITASLAELPEIPDGQLPPEGMCRIWYLDLDPGEQLDAVDCDDIGVVPENAVVVGHEGLLSKYVFSVMAYTIEKGPLSAYSRYTGVVTAPVDEGTSQFDFEVDEGQGIETDSALPVQLYEKSRVFSDDGSELDRDDIETGHFARVDAVFFTSDSEPDVLRSPFVLLSSDVEESETVMGTITAVDTGAEIIEVQTESLDTVIVDASSANIYLITSNETEFSSEEIDLDDAPIDVAVEVFGEEDDLSGNFIAEVVFIRAE